MTPKLVDPDGACPQDTAFWRTCALCGRLSAMAPELDSCDPCATGRPELRAEHFRPADLAEIGYAETVLAAGLADIARYAIGTAGQWPATAPDELARLHAALNRLGTAMAETRTLLALVERRARRRAGRRNRSRVVGVKKHRRTAAVRAEPGIPATSHGPWVPAGDGQGGSS